MIFTNASLYLRVEQTLILSQRVVSRVCEAVPAIPWSGAGQRLPDRPPRSLWPGELSAQNGSRDVTRFLTAFQGNANQRSDASEMSEWET